MFKIMNGTPEPLADTGASINVCDSPPSATNFKEKRVAVVLYSEYPSDGRPRRELSARAEQGAEVDLFCIRNDPTQARFEQDGAIRVTRMPIVHKRAGKLSYVFEYASFMLRIFL